MKNSMIFFVLVLFVTALYSGNEIVPTEVIEDIAFRNTDQGNADDGESLNLMVNAKREGEPSETRTTESWTGAVSSSWSDADNWSEGIVPNSTIDVYIPAGVPNFPIISNTSDFQHCRNLEIAEGAEICFSAGSYTFIHGNAIIDGSVNVNDDGTSVRFWEDVEWQDDSNLLMTNCNSVSFDRDCIFDEGAVVNISDGAVSMYGDEDAELIIRSEDVVFNTLSIAKQDGYSVTFSAESIYELEVDYLYIAVNSAFYSQTEESIVIHRGVICNTPNFNSALSTLFFSGNTCYFLNSGDGIYGDIFVDDETSVLSRHN